MKPLPSPFYLLALTVVLLSLWLAPVRAVSLTDSRISQLEYGLRSLQTQVNQLQSQLPRSTGGSSLLPVPSAAPVPGDPSLAEQFDNLAILVIELKQRVAALEDQILPAP
ncbi:MAG: hypothetical protein WBB01_11720 [Phormidesmis sp.]